MGRKRPELEMMIVGVRYHKSPVDQVGRIRCDADDVQRGVVRAGREGLLVVRGVGVGLVVVDEDVGQPSVVGDLPL